MMWKCQQSAYVKNWKSAEILTLPPPRRGSMCANLSPPGTHNLCLSVMVTPNPVPLVRRCHETPRHWCHMTPHTRPHRDDDTDAHRSPERDT